MNTDTQIGEGGSRFPTTIPNILDDAGSTDSAVSQQAWEALMRSYWKPVYKYLRIRHNKNNEDAKDLTQDFFVAVVEKDYFERFDIKKARFRTFLRCCVDRFVLNEYKHAGRLKRGGGAEHLSMDGDEELVLADNAQDPDVFFETEWVRSVFEQALASLAAEYKEKNKGETLRLFESYYLSEESNLSYGDLGRQFGLTTEEITNRLAGARRDFRRILLGQVKEISLSREEYKQDARKLLGIQV